MSVAMIASPCDQEPSHDPPPELTAELGRGCGQVLPGVRNLNGDESSTHHIHRKGSLKMRATRWQGLRPDRPSPLARNLL